MKPLIAAAAIFTLLNAMPCFAQLTVPGKVRGDPLTISGAPAETRPADPSAAAGNSAAAVPTDNAPIRESDLTVETAKNPTPPSLKPWAPTTTANDAAKAPPQ